MIIDGTPLQNHLVMAIPYDKPIVDIQQKMLCFGRWLGNEADRHNRIFRNGEKVENDAAKYRTIYMPYTRFSLKNVGSVLKHICSLMFLEKMRSNDGTDKLEKEKVYDVLTLLEQHKFKYRFSSADSVRKKSKKDMADVVARFFLINSQPEKP